MKNQILLLEEEICEIYMIEVYADTLFKAF